METLTIHWSHQLVAYMAKRAINNARSSTGLIRRRIREEIILRYVMVTPIVRQNIYVPSVIDGKVTPLANAGDLAKIKLR